MSTVTSGPEARREKTKSIMDQVLNPNQLSLTMHSDSQAAQGQARGFEKAKLYTGLTPFQLHEEAQRVRNLREEQFRSTDPNISRIREEALSRTRALKSQGASSSQLAASRRQSEADIAREKYRRRDELIGKKERKLGADIGIMSGEEGRSIASAMGSVPTTMPRVDMGMTVICTEMWEQGYMDIVTLYKDKEYGRDIISNRPHVYIGYRLWADPVVKLMRKSKKFSRFVAFFGMAWANNMAGRPNILGKILSKLGEPLCGILGKMLISLKGEDVCTVKD